MCRICQEAAPLETLNVPEMWFGTREVFPYQLCQGCGSLQIAEIPADLQRYYPPEYFSAWRRHPGIGLRVREALATIRNWTVLFGPAPLYTALLHIPVLGRRARINPLSPLRSNLRSRKMSIADVGGGTGQLLRVLHRLGFHDLTCVDPYLPNDVQSPEFTLLRLPLTDVSRSFDVIMYNHTLEHVPDIGHELRALYNHLNPRGLALVRLPLLPNDAFETYRTHWVQIDPPRHLHIPSRPALQRAAERAGLGVLTGGDDSWGFQFWGSELAARGIPHHRDDTGRVLRQNFTVSQLGEFERRAARLNREGRGDQGWLLLRKAS